MSNQFINEKSVARAFAKAFMKKRPSIPPVTIRHIGGSSHATGNGSKGGQK